MQISRIDLRQLRYFVAVAEELSFSRAAKQLNMSQPPLSLQIKALEEELETQLLLRTKRSVELTPAGVYLLKAARPLLRQMQDTLTYTQSAGRGDVGELRLSVNFSSLLNPRFNDLIADFRKTHPYVRLILKESVFEDAIRHLTSQQSDLCFLWPYSLASDGNIRFQLFAREPMRLCISNTNPLSQKKKLLTADLKSQNVLMSPRQGMMRLFRTLQANAHKAGFFLHIEQEAVIFPVIASLVAANYGVAYLPEYCADFGHGKIICKDLDDVELSDCHQPLAIAYHATNRNILVEQFLELAKEHAKRYA